MIQLNLNKKENVLVTGSFSRADTLALGENPTLLSAKVSSIKHTLVNLYVKGYTTYLFSSNGLFDLIVANVINELNRKGLSISIIFIKPYPDMRYEGGEIVNPEKFAHISCSFSDSKGSFDPADFDEYLNRNAECVLCPSKIKSRINYSVSPTEANNSLVERLPN